MPEPELAPVLDDGAGDHPQLGQVQCLAELPDHGLVWRCALPLLHGGDHASGPHRWRR